MLIKFSCLLDRLSPCLFFPVFFPPLSLLFQMHKEEKTIKGILFLHVFWLEVLVLAWASLWLPE